MQCVYTPTDRKFNNLAKKDGVLYNIIKDTKCPLYIDRLLGGIFYDDYKYDFDLVDEYRNILGNNFFGFQLHEWMSNFVNDTKRVIESECPKPWTGENITKYLLKKFELDYPFIEAVSPAEMAEIGEVREIGQYLFEMKKLFKKRHIYTGGDVLPCDSFSLALQLEIGMGAKRFMPEVGAQTKNTRIQLAYSRGMSKTHKIPFGVYYEPWGGSPFSATLSNKDGRTEWYTQGYGPFFSAGENGGSSRSLQQRIHIYSYMSGASFMSEEWGMANTFYDWQDFEITKYGKIKLDFIRFTEKYSNRGEFLAPIAVVLPKDMPSIDIDLPDDGTYLTYILPADASRDIRKINSALKNIFCSRSGMSGPDEKDNLFNYSIPDCIDIVHEDCADGYEYYIDLTCSQTFKKSHNCIEIDEIKAVLNRILPCRVDGDIHYFVNRLDKDRYYLTIMNNAGVTRSVEEGERYLSEADAVATVSLKDNAQLFALEGNGTVKKDSDKYFVEVPAGGWFFGEIRK